MRFFFRSGLREKRIFFSLLCLVVAVAHRAKAGDAFDEFEKTPVSLENPSDVAPSETVKLSNEDERRFPSPPLIGHNMTPTTDPLRRGDWMFGTYALAYGITDDLFIATSPWIWVSYNTANVHLKWIPYNRGRTRFGFFLSYFESFDSTPLDSPIGGSSSVCNSNCGGAPSPSNPGHHHFQPLDTIVIGNEPVAIGLNRYQWKSSSLHALYSYDFDIAMTYLSLKLSYFWNDDLPYSIRMDPGDDAIRGQVDFTQLTEFSLGDSHWKWAYECGVLGANYLYPYFHTGTSIAYARPSWLLQLGASYTIQFQEMFQASGWYPGRFDSRLHQTQDGQAYYFRYLQTALHPEVQLQFYF